MYTCMPFCLHFFSNVFIMLMKMCGITFSPKHPPFGTPRFDLQFDVLRRVSSLGEWVHESKHPLGPLLLPNLLFLNLKKICWRLSSLKGEGMKCWFNSLQSAINLHFTPPPLNLVLRLKTKGSNVEFLSLSPLLWSHSLDNLSIFFPLDPNW